jgi:hypothetical protein
MFLHILFFRCPCCREVVVKTVRCEDRNQELVDGNVISLFCERCGFKFERLGVDAKYHSTQSWTSVFLRTIEALESTEAQTETIR